LGDTGFSLCVSAVDIFLEELRPSGHMLPFVECSWISLSRSLTRSSKDGLTYG
jgi:hypothetical protein